MSDNFRAQGGCGVAQERRKVGSVSYQEAGDDYFGRRKLRRHAAFWSLWSLGVAAVIWAVFYVVFVWINIIGIEATMRFTVVINILALGILGFFFISVLASGKLDTSLWTNIPPDAGASKFLPHGIGGIFPALPFAIWFY